MRNVLVLIVFLGGAYGLIQSSEISIPRLNSFLASNIPSLGNPAYSQATLQKSSDQLLREAFENRRNSFQVEGQGTVIRILPDDLKGSRHQRFIIRLNSGQTLLVAHNIDLAPRINSLKEGDSVMFYGEYEYNPEGGVIHWTHHDLDGSHVGGWLKHNGRTYQ